MKTVVRYSVWTKVGTYLWARGLLPVGCFVEERTRQLQEVLILCYKVWSMNTQMLHFPGEDGFIRLNVCDGKRLKAGLHRALQRHLEV
jgi:hypothetical protein